MSASDIAFVELQVVEARNLRNRKWKLVSKLASLANLDSKLPKSNPFAVIALGWPHEGFENVAETRIIKGNLAPVWKEEFKLPLASPDLVVRVQILDHPKRKVLGELQVPIGELESGLCYDEWFDLSMMGAAGATHSSKAFGQLRLALKLTLPNEIDEGKRHRGPDGKSLRVSNTVALVEDEPPLPPDSPQARKVRALRDEVNRVAAHYAADSLSSCVREVIWCDSMFLLALLNTTTAVSSGGSNSNSSNVSAAVEGSGDDALRLNLVVSADYPGERPFLLLQSNPKFDEHVVEGLIDAVNEFGADRSHDLESILAYTVNEFTRRFPVRGLSASLLHSATHGTSTRAAGELANGARPAASPDSSAPDDSDPEEEEEEDSDSDENSEFGVDNNSNDTSEFTPYASVAFPVDNGMSKDFELLQLLFSPKSASLLADIHVVRLFLNCNFMQPEVASALGVIREQPIHAVLTFSDLYTLAARPPKVEFKQPGNASFGLEYQLTQLCRNFLEANWPSRGGQQQRQRQQQQQSASSASASASASLPLSRLLLLLSSSTHTMATDGVTAGPRSARELADLSGRGWEQLAVAHALTQCKFDLAEATRLLAEAGRPVVEELSSRLLERSFLLETMCYLIARLESLTSYCIICDTKLAGSGLKPVVCGNAMCIWRYEELGLGVKVVNELANESDVVDLMIAMSATACMNDRRELIFDPFPPDFLSGGGSVKKPDYDMARDVFARFPSVDEMCADAPTESTLRQRLDSLDPENKRVYRLLRWVLTSNRAHLIKLSPDRRIKEMQTDHQYLMLSAAPEKYNKFLALKAKYGSFFAFHGSSIENFHAIMRFGLRNLSNTKLMTCGAAFGAGIYLSPEAQTSSGYAKPGPIWEKSRLRKSASCQALMICEVIDHESLKGMPNPHWVVSNEDLVVTRFFLIYCGSPIPSVHSLRQLSHLKSYFEKSG